MFVLVQVREGELELMESWMYRMRNWTNEPSELVNSQLNLGRPEKLIWSQVRETSRLA